MGTQTWVASYWLYRLNCWSAQWWVQTPTTWALVLPSLVEVNEEDDVISETGQSVGGWHGDDEGEHVVDEGIEGLAEGEIGPINIQVNTQTEAVNSRGQQ